MSDENGKTKQFVTSDDRFSGLRRHSEEVNKLAVESLQGALLQLIVKKPYDRITVTELCRKAGVSRMAFYGNFQSKDDIFRRIITDLHGELIARVGSPFRQTFSGNWYVKMFNFAAEKSNILQPIFAAGYRDKYLEFVNTMVLQRSTFSVEEKYVALLWTGAIINATVQWLTSGRKETPEQMANYCSKCLSDFVPCHI